MSLAAEARSAVQERPFLYEALRAGVVNYSAAARALDVGDDEAAVATALRRYSEELPAWSESSRRATVTMQSGLEADTDDRTFLTVNGTGFAAGDGDLTGVLATGEVDTLALGYVLGRLATAGVSPTAAGATDRAFCLVVDRRSGPRTVQVVEAALESVPDPTV